MKCILYLTITILLLSCGSQKQVIQDSKNSPSFSIENNLTEIESSIINDFMDVELKESPYKYYKDFEIVVIEEAFKKTKPLSVYEFNLKYKESWGEFIKYWILDSLQVKKIKLELKNEEAYYWKTTDFKDIKVSLLKHEELRKMLQTNTLFNDSARLVFYLSKPLIIDRKHALLSYEVNKCNHICTNMTHFTVLMKMENGKWIKDQYYEDGVYY